MKPLQSTQIYPTKAKPNVYSTPCPRLMLMVTQYCWTPGMCDGGEVRVERDMMKIFTLENFTIQLNWFYDKYTQKWACHP